MKTIRPETCVTCGRAVDPESSAVLAGGGLHPQCAHPAWRRSIVASGHGGLDGLTVRLHRARLRLAKETER